MATEASETPVRSTTAPPLPIPKILIVSALRSPRDLAVLPPVGITTPDVAEVVPDKAPPLMLPPTARLFTPGEPQADGLANEQLAADAWGDSNSKRTNAIKLYMQSRRYSKFVQSRKG